MDLDAAGYGISDLSGLSKLVNLQSLVLSNNLVDGNDLAHIPENVRHLTLDYNPLTDVSELAGLTRLQSLSLDETSVRGTDEATRSAFALPDLRFLSVSIAGVTPDADLAMAEGDTFVADGTWLTPFTLAKRFLTML